MAEDKHSPVYSKWVLSWIWRLSGMQEHSAVSLESPGLGVCLLFERCSYLFQDTRTVLQLHISHTGYRTWVFPFFGGFQSSLPALLSGTHHHCHKESVVQYGYREFQCCFTWKNCCLVCWRYSASLLTLVIRPTWKEHSSPYITEVIKLFSGLKIRIQDSHW